MNEIIKIDKKIPDTETVNARELHIFLESKQEFSSWIKARIMKYGFEENSDYIIIKVNDKNIKNLGGRPTIEYHVSLDMAKEISMAEGNEKGRAARKYFINCEKALKNVSGNIEKLVAAEIKKQLESVKVKQIESPKKEKPIIIKNYQLLSYTVSLVKFKGKTYQITPNFYNKHKCDLRFYDKNREWGPEIKTGFLSLDQLYRYMERNL